MARFAFEAFPRALNNNGDPISGAKLYVFEAGATTAATVYSDSGFTTAHAHPIIADSGGYFPAIYAKDGSYKVRVTDAVDVVMYEADNVTQETVSSLESKILKPASMRWIFLSDGQPVHQFSSDNTHGHDQVAAWRGVMDDISTNFSDARAVFHCGDVVDEGRQKDTGKDPEYTLPDYISDVYSRLPVPRSRVFEVSGNHDNNYGQWDEQEHARTFHEARRYLAPGFYHVDWGSVRTIHMSDYLPQTAGVIPEHVREWFKRVVFEANAHGKFIVVCTHQPLQGTGLVGASGNGNHAESDWFLNLIREPGYSVDVWFSGHAGEADDDVDGPNDILFAGCRFLNINMRIPGAYNAASGVPTSDLHYVVMEFTDGSADVSIKRWNQTDQQFVVADTLTLTHGHKIQLAHQPDFNGRLQQDSRHGVREGLLPGQSEWLVNEHPREVDTANDVTLGTDPLATTDGSAVVTVTDTGHGLATDGSDDGREVNIRGADATNGIPAQNLNRTHRVTVVDANSYTFTAAQDATATGSGGGSSVKRNRTWKLLDSEPFYVQRLASYAPRGANVVGMGAGVAVYIPYATANSGAGEGTEDELAADLVEQRGFGAAWWAKLLNLSSRACSLILSATTGPMKSDRVDVVELHPTDGPKALVGTFQYQIPCFSVTDENDIDLATAASTLYPTGLSAAEFDIGSNLNLSTGVASGAAGEVWEYYALVQFKSNSGANTMRVDFELDGSTIFAKASKDLDASQAADFIAITGQVKFASAGSVKLKITGHGGGSTQDINWITWTGKRISAGN